MGNASMLSARPTLRAWVDEYAAIAEECLAGLAEQGIDLGPSGRHEPAVRAAKRRLRDKGAVLRNAGASIVAGPLSPACAACSDGLGSKTFVLSMRCNRSCYFCFNVNQGDEGERCAFNEGWRSELDEFAASCENVTHVGLTGGEPLLHPSEAVEFVRYVRAEHPPCHVRLYTAGDFLDEAILAELRDAGLDELRMSVKIDVLDAGDEDGIIEAALEKVALAKRFIPAVMVEMPAIPGTGRAMRRLLDRLDEAGAFGINLLEFGFPMGDWAAFRERGFEAKNPPFPIPYDYSYPGGLPIDGSELLCLELLEYALDEGLSLGVHYCSLENKNRGQVFRQNAAVRLDPRLYELDGEDFFYKTAKVYDGDVPLVRERLVGRGIPFEIDGQDGSLQFHPDRLGEVDDLPVLPALSYNVVEQSARRCAVRELKLEVLEGDAGMDDKDLWQARATAWELLALTFAYPGDVLAQAVASGEWCEAADEVAQACGIDLPEGWSEGLPGGDGGLVGGALEDGGPEDAAPGGAGVDALLRALRREATRLFVGAPEPACSPYEGVWRAEAEGVQPLLFVNPHSMAVERFVRACGLGRPAGTNEPLDHVSAECELLQYLASLAAGLAAPPEGAPAPEDLPGGSPAGAYGAFLDDHARMWMPRFAEAVAAESREPLYRAAARLLAAIAG